MDANTQDVAPEVRVLTMATCSSTSGKSKLTYEIGCTPDNEVHIRIASNTGARRHYSYGTTGIARTDNTPSMAASVSIRPAGIGLSTSTNEYAISLRDLLTIL